MDKKKSICEVFGNLIAREDIRKSREEARGTVRRLRIVSPDQNLRYVPTASLELSLSLSLSLTPGNYFSKALTKALTKK